MITWGEFLLKFISDASLPDSRIDRAEIVSLLRTQGRDNEFWALVPLALPNEALKQKPRFSAMNAEALKAEVHRLANERTYLLSRYKPF